MHITIAQQALSRALSVVHTIAGAGKTQMPILKHLLVTAHAHGLDLSASNEETSVRYRLRTCDVQAAGSLLVPVHLLTELVQNLPVAPVTFSPSPTDATSMQVRCQHVKATLKQPALAIEEFPRMAVLADGGQVFLTIDCELLREIITQVAFTAATDDSRPALTGLRISFEGGMAHVAAANAFRLATRTIAVPDPTLTAEVLIPAHTLRLLARVLPSSGAVQFGRSADGNQIVFHTDEMDVSGRLLAGSFPSYQSLLTGQTVMRVAVETHALRDAVRLIAPFARASDTRLTLEASPTDATLLLSAHSPDLGSNEIRLQGSILSGPGSTMQLRVNETYLTDLLPVIPTPQVVLEFQGARKPFLVKPMGEGESVYVIMPLISQATQPVQRPDTAVAASVA